MSIVKSPATTRGNGGYGYDFTPRDYRNAPVRKKQEKVSAGNDSFSWEEMQAILTVLVDGATE